MFSRVYHLSEEEASIPINSASTRRTRTGTSDSETKTSGSSPKKHKNLRAQEPEASYPQDGIYCFHPEDEIIAKVSMRFWFPRLLSTTHSQPNLACNSLFDISVPIPCSFSRRGNTHKRVFWARCKRTDISAWRRRRKIEGNRRDCRCTLRIELNGYWVNKPWPLWHCSSSRISTSIMATS